MRKSKLLIMTSLFLSFLSPLGATITASYEAEPYLAFETGQFPFDSTDFVAHLGTLTFYISDNQLFDPSLVDMSVSNTFGFSGPVTYYNHWETGLPVYNQATTYFSLASVTTVRGTTSYKRLWGADGMEPLTNANGNLNTSVFVAKLYFLGDQSASIYKPGALYTLTSGIIGGFNVAVASSGGGIYNDSTYISVNDQIIPENGTPPTNPIPVIPGTITPLPYVDPDHPLEPVDYAFTITDNQSFSIQNAFNTNVSEIAKAQLILTNAIPDTMYGVNIKFNNTTNSLDFSLHLEGITSQYAIPYQLRFLNQAVVGGTPLIWSNLINGTHLQSIFITGINASTAEMAPSGSYSDLITVTVTPIDTL